MGGRLAAVEGLVIDRDFWSGKRVLLAGHTGFKGGWLALWLQSLGAQVLGYSLPAPTQPNLFQTARISESIQGVIADIRDLQRLMSVYRDYSPEVVFHLAAQPIVRASYDIPVETYSTNVMGTVHALEAARHCPAVRAIVNVTSDKCYDNREWDRAYSEGDPMGGKDPYSSSKACAELITAAYRSSFFSGAINAPALASVRAGNVIGGGDWATDRIVPDFVRATQRNEPLRVRNPRAIRPWQHVLEPLSGYLMLAERLWNDGAVFSSAWNFGPDSEDARPVEMIADKLALLWGQPARWAVDPGPHPVEAHFLKLDSSKARLQLGWKPRLGLDDALAWTVEWYKSCAAGADARALCLGQIEQFGKLTVQ